MPVQKGVGNDDTIRIVIVDDHMVFREGLKNVLEAMDNVKVIGSAENGESFLSLLHNTSPDIVFMDIRMPVMDGIEAVEKGLLLKPDLKVIILTMFGEEDYLFTLIHMGISGYLLKTAKIFEIERAVELVARGDQYFSAELNGMLAKKLKQFKSQEVPLFKPRESEVLQLLCNGFSTSEISELMHLSKRTVEGYRSKLMEKTNQPNVINLILYAIKNKLVTYEELKPRHP